MVAVGDNVSGFVWAIALSQWTTCRACVVPKNLCALIPPRVIDESASFTSGLYWATRHRLLSPPWWTFVVGGLGLIGLHCSVAFCARLPCSWFRSDPSCTLAEDLGFSSITLCQAADPAHGVTSKPVAVCGWRLIAAATTGVPYM